MGHSRTKRLLCCFFILSILICSFAALSGHAEDYPNIDNINPSWYLNDNQQFFHRPVGYVLISTNSTTKTYVALLDSDGELDYACALKALSFPFVYQKAALYDDILYIAGDATKTAGCVQIERINLSTGEYKMNQILNAKCDFSRGISADAKEKFSLVTFPVGGSIEPTTPASHYLFDTQEEGASLLPLPADTVSSSINQNSSTVSNTESEVHSSVPSSAASTSPSSTVTSQPESEPPLSLFPFEGQATVASLQKELDANGLGQELHVYSADNIECKTGCIGTGQIIKTYLNNKLENQYIAVIPGDLDGTGTVTKNDLQILYTYFTKSPTSSQPVLSGTFYDAAKISDDLKIDTARSALLTSDLLNIKKLEK